MAIKLSNELRSKIVEFGFLGNLSGYARLDIYNGTAPATASETVTGSSGTLLVSIGTAGITWLSATGGTSSLNGSFSGTAVASGTATWARLVAVPSGTQCAQGSCGTSLSEEFILSQKVISTNDVVWTTSCEIVQPAE